MLSSRPYCRVTRLDEAASRASLCTAAGRPSVSLVARKLPMREYERGLETAARLVSEALLVQVALESTSSKLSHQRFSHRRARSAAVHDTVAFDDSRRPRTRSLAIACSRGAQKKEHCKSLACKAKSRHAVAITNHDARRDDSRKTPGKNVIRLRAPTTRTEVRKLSSARVQSRS